ncbi:NADH dehydrogenase [ubiquinone] iron-sulfur protein 4, mitochondrial [[Candida] zeylanoides]
MFRVATAPLRALRGPGRPCGARGLAASARLNQKVNTPAVYDQSTTPKELVSGAPRDLATKRVVRIYQEAKPATQSGHHNGDHWKLDWDVLGAGNRWENDLIGYQGTADYMQGTIMKFDTKQSAIAFARGQGWDHYVQEPKQKHFRKKEYAMNFFHVAGPLKHIRTK